jgi:hypothetical protein
MWRVMVGIELGRAVPQVEGYQPRPFGCEVGSQFRHRPRFPGPPVSSRTVGFLPPEAELATMAYPQQAFPPPSTLKCRPTYTPRGSGLLAGSTSPGTYRGPRAQSPGTSPLDAHHAPRASFAPSGCYPSGSGVSRRLERHCPSLIAHRGSCAGPVGSPSLRPWPRSVGPCRLLPAPAGRWSPGRPEEFRHQSPTEPYVNLSDHPSCQPFSCRLATPSR